MSTKRMSRVAILAALAIALRFAFASFPNIKPIAAIFLICLLYFPLFDSLLIMTLTMLGSSLLFGFGIVVCWQILSFAGVLLLWKYLVLPLIKNGKLSIPLQSFLAGFSMFFYGFLISLLSAVQYGVNPFVYWLNGLTFDLLHVLSTALFYPIIYHIFRRFLE